MEHKKIFSDIIKSVFDAEVLEYSQLGGGAAGGIIYKLEFDKNPFVAVIKTADNKSMLKEECDYIRYIQKHADIKLPEIYSDFTVDGEYFVVMEYFDGVNCLSEYVLEASEENRQKVADQIADNIIKLQAVKGEKFGDLFSPEFENWNDFYKPFVKAVLNEADGLYKEGYITQHILEALHKAFDFYDIIFGDFSGKPTIIHGDYWAENIIVNENYELIGVLDPFNSMWGDSEYELFALNAMHNGKIPVLEAFMSKQAVSEKFMVKNYFYFLFSETFWVTKLHHDNVAYLNEIIANLNTEMIKIGLINN